MIKILSVFGTRPEAIKMAPVLQRLKDQPDRAKSVLCATAQHRHMLDQVLPLFGLAPDYDLDIMRCDQSPTQVAASCLEKLEAVLRIERPDWVLVQGDTTTATAASLAAFYAGARVGHVEAGLRTNKRREPFPEEMNRQITGAIADLHFAPTARARDNLLREGVRPESIHVTGNTVIDALFSIAALPGEPEPGPLGSVPWDRRIILVTAHRRENFGAPFEQICLALRDIARAYADTVHLVYPVHPNPNVAGPARRILGGEPNITLTESLNYRLLVHLLSRAVLVLTDSGGIQEEAPGLGKPVLVLRDVTERPEGVEAGTVRVAGTDRARIVDATRRLLDDAGEYQKMARAVNPYGDGHAAVRIVRALLQTP